MAELIHCPSCQRSLRVPDEMIGRTVKCPDCGMMFSTVSNSSPATPVDGGLTVQPIGAPPPVERYAPEAGLGLTLIAPALALLLIGGIGSLIAVSGLLSLPQITEEDIQEVIQQQRQNMPPDPDQREMVERGMRAMFGPPGLAAFGVYLGLNVLVVLTALMMMARRFYALCVVGSIVALIFDGCWCLGVPVGLWSLLVLTRSDVRAAFH